MSSVRGNFLRRIVAEIAVCLIGYGTAGSVFHAPLIDATPGLALAAVVTRNPGRAAEVASRYPHAQVISSAEGVFAEPDKFDVVVIATPHSSHLPLARRALAAGLRVVIDKPLALSWSEANDFHQELLAEGSADRVGVFQNRRWDGDFLTVAELVQSGRIGEAHRLESRFERWRPTPRDGSWRELAPRAEGGGVLLDLGSHLADQAITLFGEVETVYAEEFNRRDGVTAGDDVFISLQHVAGPVSHLWATATAALPAPRFRVLGAKGAYEKYGLDGQEAQLRQGMHPTDTTWGTEPSSTWGTIAIDDTQEAWPTLTGAWPMFYAAVKDAVAFDRPLPVPVGSVLHAMSVLDAARRSATEDRVVAPRGRKEKGNHVRHQPPQPEAEVPTADGSTP
jgi:predicted dehydrogenase